MGEDIRAPDTTIAGEERFIRVNGRTWRYLNQRSREWTHLYEYNGSGGTLTTSGCGIFSTCHAVEFFSGERISVEELADFSCSVGGRGEDGTNRPMLLKGMVEKGLAAKYGFRYDAEHINFDDHEGHLNDHEALWDCLMGGGCALTNIRRGHIVNLIACRTAANGERQAPVLDCHSESADDRVKDRVREVLPNSAIRFPVYNESGVMTGINVSYGAFWVPLFMPMDFDLLYKV